MLRNRASLAAVLAVAATLAGGARAQESADKGKLEEARQHVARAKVHYDLGEFKEAADEYIIVYRLRPLPALLFNIAQAYRQGGMYDKARQFYKTYLREAPDLKNKAMIEQAIREMDDLLTKERKTKDGPPRGLKTEPVADASRADAPLPLPAKPEPKSPEAVAKPDVVAKKTETTPALPEKPAKVESGRVAEPETKTAVTPASKPPPLVAVATPPPARTPGVKPAAPSSSVGTETHPRPVAEPEGKSHVVSWVLAGTSVALLGGGAAFMVKANGTDNDLQSGFHTRAAADDLISQSKSSHRISAILFGAGAAAAVAAAVFFFLPSGDSAPAQGKL